MTTSRPNIARYVHFNGKGFAVNGKDEPVLLEGVTLNEKLRSGYQLADMRYPKFHKMDPLCKLAVLTAEKLLPPDFLDRIPPEQVGVLLFNRHSSIDSDVAHQQSITNMEDGLASPAVFVYTLPNVMLGEICIRQGFKGENACFIAPRFDADMALKQSELMFQSGMQALLLGWVDTFGESARAWMAWAVVNGDAPNISQLSTTFLSELDNSAQWTNS